jgi:uncharacterized protein YcaQ
MPKHSLPASNLRLSKADTRRFLLAHQHLWPPRRREGKAGIMDFVRHVGCIQFDPINVVGRNPDLVLQSRVADYRPTLLEELLYIERQLLDGFDKVASIYPTGDWSYFARRRVAMEEWYTQRFELPAEVLGDVLEIIRQRGPLSSIDLKDWEKVSWTWGNQVRLSRAALETLYESGKLVVHHRTGTRRSFELPERVLPPGLLSARDPNQSKEAYQDWHVLRRVGGLGLANPRAAEYWLGILGVKTQTRRAILNRLVDQGELVPVAVEEVPDQTLFMRTADLPTVERVQNDQLPEPQAAILGPLDNLMWDRNLLRWIFDFDYVWEVYKPAAKRVYGYYVLPVIYGDRFIARFDPALDKKAGTLTVNNWWWEDGVQVDEPMEAALIACFRDFMGYLGAPQIQIGREIVRESTLNWMSCLNSLDLSNRNHYNER